MLNGFLQYITFESHQAIKHVHYKLNKITPSNITHLLNTLGTTFKKTLPVYTGRILQQSDSDVHSAVAAKTSTALLQQWY